MKDYFRMKRETIETAQKIPRKHFYFLIPVVCRKVTTKHHLAKFLGVLQSRIASHHRKNEKSNSYPHR